jgi:hypothetical protein
MQMTNADVAMWYVLGALTLLVIGKAYARSQVRRLRSHVFRLHEQHSDNKVEIELLREEAVSLRERLELALVDWKRAERKLARARTSRARWQALGAEHERRYRNEFKRADQAETRLMRWQYVHRYDTPAPAFKVVGVIAVEDLRAGTPVKVVP